MSNFCNFLFDKIFIFYLKPKFCKNSNNSKILFHFFKPPIFLDFEKKMGNVKYFYIIVLSRINDYDTFGVEKKLLVTTE